MLLVDVPNVPGVGCEVLYAADKAPATGQTAATATSLRATTRLLENRFFRLRFNARGEITSLFDKRAGREVLAPGERGNVFQLFEDKPGLYDAWDIVAQYREKSWDISPVERIGVVERGPVRAALRLEKRFFQSRLVQTIIVYDRLPRIDFETWVDWREHNRLLKVCFPVRVLARRATYDLSYGSIQRPTSRNTSWEQAKFEVCGHQWADLSEAGYGVSLLNDCKYGHDIEGHRMRLSLLRGPIRPDPDSDQGEHEFTYSLFPHAGSWQEGGTVREAQALNSPLLAVPAARRGRPPEGAGPRRKGGPGSVAPGRPMVSVEGEGVFLGALKPAEDGGGFIVRLVEVHGGRPRATVRFAGGARRKGRAPAGRGGPAARVRAVRETDLLERPLPAAGRPPEGAGPPAVRGTGFTTRLAPFEIKTFLVTLGH
jgi:alpha-mannosidase